METTALIEQKSDLEQLRFAVVNDISCEATIKDSFPCSSTSQNITENIELLKNTPSGLKTVLGEKYGEGYRFGRYLVKAGCSKSEQSLIVQAIPFLDTKEGPENRRRIKWGDRQSLLFGGAEGGIPLCYNANAIGSVAMAKDDPYGDVTLLSGPPLGRAIRQRSIRLANGESLRGLECKEDEGFRLTGCFNEVNSKANREAAKPIQRGNICVAPSSMQSQGNKAPAFVERTLTIICLKAE